MSTLEQIRKRPGLVIGVLGFALLLFIVTLTDWSPVQSCIAGGDAAAKVDGQSIKYTEWSARAQQAYDQQREAYRSRGQNPDAVSLQQVQEQVLQQMITEALMEQSMDNLGITVTDDEISKILFTEPALPMVQQLVMQAQQYAPEANIVSAADLYRFSRSNKTEVGEYFHNAWNEMEQNVRQQLRQAKYQMQFQALTANKLDAQQYYDENARTATLVMARQNYTTLPDDEFQVSDDEINARYNQEKELFKVDKETRIVDYILVRPAPSADDYAEAQAEVNEALANLAKLPDTDGVSGNYNFTIETIESPVNSISDYVIKGAVETLKADSAGVKMLQFANNKYTIAKLLKSYTASDTANIDIIAVEKANADSVLAKLNAGADVASLGDKVLQSQLDFGMPTLNSDFDLLKKQYDAAGQGKYFVLDMPGNQDPNTVVISRLVSYNAPSNIVKIAKITRDVVPSNATLNSLEEKLNAYRAEHPTLQEFKDSAAAASFTVLETSVTPDRLSIINLPSSGVAARWAMENDKGSISEVFYDNARSYMLVLAVEDVFDEYFPATNENVKSYLTDLIRNEKKGEKLVAQYKGKAKDIAGYANLMKASTDTVAGVSYGRDSSARGLSTGDPKFYASFANAKKGQLVGPIDTRNSVVVYQIIDEEMMPRKFDFQQDGQAFSQSQGAARLLNNIEAIILGNKQVDYYVQRFQNAD